jgi:hypothetical protein
MYDLTFWPAHNRQIPYFPPFLTIMPRSLYDLQHGQPHQEDDPR